MAKKEKKYFGEEQSSRIAKSKRKYTRRAAAETTEAPRRKYTRRSGKTASWENEPTVMIPVPASLAFTIGRSLATIAASIQK